MKDRQGSETAAGNRSLGKKLLLFILLSALLCACSTENHDAEQKSSGPKAPEFSLEDLDGGVHRLSDFRGDVVMLNFFATWCAPCRKEVPDLVKLHRRLAKKGLQIIGVSLDEEGAKVLRPFIKKHDIGYPIVLATEKVVFDYGGMQALPTTFLIDHKGSIRDRFLGAAPGHQIEASVRSLLKKRG
jgi:peroxiredoxin